jgi:anti-sigma factor RsiW
MTTPISPDDWEILSAYLDGQVTDREKEQLRLRLDSDPALQHALEEMQRTKMVLRSVPRKRVPHNFTLTPAMLPKRKAWFGLVPNLRYGSGAATLVPTLSFASGLATLLLVLTFTFQFLPGLRNAAQPPAAAAPSAALSSKSSPALPPAASDQSLPSANEAAPLVIWGGAATGMGGAGGGNGGGGVDQVSPGTGVIETPGFGIGGGPTAEPAGGNQPLPTEPAQLENTPSPTETGPSIAAVPTEIPVPSRSSVASTPAPSSGNGLILGIRPTEEMGKIVIDQGADQYSNQSPAPRPAPTPTPTFLSRNLVPIQIGLVLLALAAGAAAFYLRRRL